MKFKPSFLFLKCVCLSVVSFRSVDESPKIIAKINGPERNAVWSGGPERLGAVLLLLLSAVVVIISCCCCCWKQLILTSVAQLFEETQIKVRQSISVQQKKTKFQRIFPNSNFVLLFVVFNFFIDYSSGKNIRRQWLIILRCCPCWPSWRWWWWPSNRRLDLAVISATAKWNHRPSFPRKRPTRIVAHPVRSFTSSL